MRNNAVKGKLQDDGTLEMKRKIKPRKNSPRHWSNVTTFPDVLAASREENFHSTENSYKGIWGEREKNWKTPFFTTSLSFSMHSFEFYGAGKKRAGH